MKSIKRGSIVAAFAAFAALFTCGASASVTAAPATPRAISVNAEPRCDAGTWCVWQAPNYLGSSAEGLPIASGYCWSAALVQLYTFYSIINDTSQYQRVWSNPNCTGQYVLVAPNTTLYDIPFQGTSIGGY